MEQKKLPLGLVAGANLKRLMKEKHYTQEAFADIFSADVTTVRRWIRLGINNLALIEQIASFFGINPLDMLVFTD